MKAPFHYIVKAKVIRQTKGNEFDFEEINKKFETENPIIAREEAFRYYQSWIDILLEHKGKNYVSDSEARKELISFIEPGATAKLQTGDKELEFSDESLGNGIGVFFVKNISIDSSIFLPYLDVGEEGLIHGIGNLIDQYVVDSILIVLREEAKYYEYFNYETNNKIIEVTYCNQSPISIDTHKILKTPFDWEGYDKRYWWGKPEDEEIEPMPKNIEKLIQQGESNQVEFKTTLHFRKDNNTIKIKEDIAKTICAFLNLKGGFLFIGIKDNKEVQGLDFDFSLANGKDPKDYFLLEIDNMLESIGLSVIMNISSQFYEIEGKEIFCITVSPSKGLIFLKDKEGKELWIRAEASTSQIKDAEEIINYWKKKNID